MARFICPNCGSEYFVTSKTAGKTVFQVLTGKEVRVVQSSAAASDGSIDIQHIYCGACSWQGSLHDLTMSHRD